MEGCSKLDSHGNVIPGVTAKVVKDILPMHHGEILKVNMLINDDDLDQMTRDASYQVNGHLMHLQKNVGDAPRWQFYTKHAESRISRKIKELVVGKKRTAKEADLTDIPAMLEDTSVLLKHVRDYAFTEQRGGTKGESADYIL